MESRGPGLISAALFAGAARVLCIGAHPDDIEIGCGGTLLSLRRQFPDLHVRWLVMSGSETRRAEAEKSAELLLGDPERVAVLHFRDGFLPYGDVTAVKQALLDHRAGFAPDVVFAPRPGDAHQDHRLLGELAWQVYRQQVVLHYEVVKYEGDLAAMNAYVALDDATVTAKIDHLVACFPSQHDKPWFDAELFRGLMRVRGVESGSASGYAEAFEVPKLVVS